MKVLRIRQWMIIGMLLFMTLPGLSYLAAHSVESLLSASPEPPAPAQQSRMISQVVQNIASHRSQWENPAWQSALKKELEGLHLSVDITTPAGKPIFRSATHPGWNHGGTSTLVVENGRVEGSVDVYALAAFDRFAAMAALAGLVCAILFVGWQMRRSVVRPLEALAEAARRIAVGELNFRLPLSRVSEIREVQDAFEAMGEGLRASISRQAELEEERRFFIGAIAHDLRSPLFVLRGCLDGIDAGIARTPEKLQTYLAVCRQKANQLDRLVADLFAYTKSAYLDQSLQTVRLNPEVLTKRVVHGFEELAAKKGVRLMSTASGMPNIEADEHLLERVVENLLDNALRFTPSGGRVEVEWYREGSRLLFEVRDSGPGICRVELEHIFEPLYRGEASRSRDTGGTGLGLAIARRIMRAHGGDLTGANGAPGGAVFTGWLPLPASAGS